MNKVSQLLPVGRRKGPVSMGPALDCTCGQVYPMHRQRSARLHLEFTKSPASRC